MMNLLLALALTFPLACGDDDGGGEPAGNPGTITVTVPDITGQMGNRVTILAGDQKTAGSYCEDIDGDPDSVTGTVGAFPGGQPCEVGAAVQFPAGSYAVTASVYMAGASMPVACSSGTVTVDGDASITLAAPGACM